MAEITADLSSYPKPVEPPGLISQVKDLAGLEQQKLGIDKQKLDLVNQRFGYLAKGLTSLSADPDLNEDKVRKYATDMVKLGYIPNDMAAKFISSLPPTQGMAPAQAAAALKAPLQTAIQQAQTTQEAIQSHYGTIQQQSDNANIYTGVQASPMRGGGFTPTTVTPQQLPPTIESLDTRQNLPNGEPNPNFMSRGPIGARGPAGPHPFSGGPADPRSLAQSVSPSFNPTQGNLTDQNATVVPTVPAAKGLRDRVSGPTGPTIHRVDLEGADKTPANFDDRFGSSYPHRVVSSMPPGVEAAAQATAAQSGKDLASARTLAGTFNDNIYPIRASLKAIKELGPQAIGPGTDQFNDLKRAFVTWLPNVDPKLIEQVSNADQLRKYLVQAARTSGNTATNDQLAAAFDANPNTKMSTAGVDTVLKSMLALMTMKQAQTLLFEKTGLRDDQYSKWAAQNQNVFDPRAFAFKEMSRKAQDKLVKSLSPEQRKKFEYSLEFAREASLVEPPKLKR